MTTDELNALARRTAEQQAELERRKAAQKRQVLADLERHGPELDRDYLEGLRLLGVVSPAPEEMDGALAVMQAIYEGMR